MGLEKDLKLERESYIIVQEYKNRGLSYRDTEIKNLGSDIDFFYFSRFSKLINSFSQKFG